MSKLVARTEELVRVGDPLLESTNMGPVVSGMQRDKILEAVRHAVEKDGCKVLAGGSEAPAAVAASADLSGGFYVPPTILSDVSLDAECWREEIFGPVLAVRTFSSEDEAVKAANDSPYGLAHAVMSGDAGRLDRVTSRLRSGVVWQNCSQPNYPTTPFGGCKQSGFGRELGEAGLEEYVHAKTVTTSAPGHSWAWYGETA